MTEPIDNEDFENKKKVAELDKLNKEIKKIEAETEEIISKKRSAWAPMIGSIIIGIITLSITWGTGFFNGKLELIEAKALVMQVRKDSLSRRIDSLQSIYRKDSINFLTRIKNKDKNLDSLSQKFIQDRKTFDKERVKYSYVISQKQKEIAGLKKEKDILSFEISKAEDCVPKAKEFLLEYCVKTKVPRLSYDSLIRQIPPPPYKTRFNKSFEEIAKLDISKINYSEFLQSTANFKIVDNSFSVNVVSEDGLISVIVYANRGNLTIRQAPAIIADITYKFECFKKLNPTQRLKLLNEVTRRIN
jgi:hypothetical protein